MEYLIPLNSYKSVTKEITIQSTPFKGENNQYHYVYEIFVPSTGWIYVGSKGEDSYTSTYMGSPSYDTFKDDVNKSGSVKFKILSFHKTREEAYDEEIRLVTKEFILQPKVYNKSIPRNGFNTIGCIPVKYNDNRPNNDPFLIKNDDPRWILCEVIHVNKGLVRSDETRKKISESKKGTKESNETRKNKSEGQKGRKHSDKSRYKIRDKNIYIFYNKELDITENCTKQELLDRYQLGRRGVGDIINKKCKSTKGWTFHGKY